MTDLPSLSKATSNARIEIGRVSEMHLCISEAFSISRLIWRQPRGLWASGASP